MTREDFIKQIGAAAVEDARKSRVLPSLTIAQAALESNWGKSALAVKGKNLFGIKGEGDAGYGMYQTTEYINGKPVSVQAKFRHYSSWLASIRDHSDLFHRLKRYKDVVGETDYKKACKAVQAAGYATDPQYANKLISLIETYKLYEYDREVTKVEVKGTVNGKPISGYLIDGSVYVPLRVVGETLGAVVNWDNAAKKFEVVKK